MAYEDLTTYTEVDPNSRLSLSASELDVNFTKLNRNDPATYLYKDFGENYFHLDDLKINFVTSVTDYTNYGAESQGVANDIGATADWINPYLIVRWYKSDSGVLYLKLIGCGINTGYSALPDTTYYLTLQEKDGTVYLYIYSNSNRTNLITTLSGTPNVPVTQSFRYLYACVGHCDSGGNYYITGKDGAIEIINAGTAPPSDNSIMFGANF